jgi:hypothetical protein
MLHYWKKGFKTATKQSFALLVLWLYHFAGGFALLAFVKSIVVPLMHRYPGGNLPETASHLFLAEGQFRLMKTDISHPYLWALLAIAAARMLLTPLLNAGVYYSLLNPHLNSGYRFIQGIRRLSGPFLGYYVLQLLLTLAPLYWLYPIARDAFTHQKDYMSLATVLLPWLAGYAAYVSFVRLVFVYVQLGRTAEAKLGRTLWLFVRKLPIIAVLAIGLIVLSGLATTAVVSASLIWAGISALILQQLYHLVSLLFKLWSISTQYHFYEKHAA